MDLFTNTVTVFLESFGINPALSVWGNSLFEYLMALALFVVLTVVFKVIQFVILRRLVKLAKSTKTDIDDTLIRIVESLRPQFYGFLAFYLALFSLELSTTVGKVFTALLLVFIVYQVIKATGVLIDYVSEKRMQKEKAEGGKIDPGTTAVFNLVRTLSKILLWAVGLLLILSNLGIEITSLIAGLGIGGLAIALALQNILTDLFSSFAIYFDKPFEVGDFITVGEHSGTVEQIGIKTTRLRALQGEEIVISNQELTSARIQNLKKMKERRVSFSFGVVYDTSAETLKAIPEMVRKIFDEVKSGGARLDRAHFKTMSDSSLDFDVVYYVPTREYSDYLDIQQELNLKIIEQFKKEKIEFAYPTQTVYVGK